MNRIYIFIAIAMMMAFLAFSINAEQQQLNNDNEIIQTTKNFTVEDTTDKLTSAGFSGKGSGGVFDTASASSGSGSGSGKSSGCDDGERHTTSTRSTFNEETTDRITSGSAGKTSSGTSAVSSGSGTSGSGSGSGSGTSASSGSGSGSGSSSGCDDGGRHSSTGSRTTDPLTDHPSGKSNLIDMSIDSGDFSSSSSPILPSLLFIIVVAINLI
ncbi:hypothetical protein DFA_09257 [Cavenderia fasciculata]|uniref:Uncharacterized protein n=1 Tax=Cavenderia fasciculata TaxID=261658 RepID=F4Q745_CACFS|nr:uncharacterized protein DFA_09257 [Cavenderia fasciculata]EGG16227.1 hypothetical protein DFA_09257 [Cavenderia fasciculata]|eukprot:XP_004354611.1 hypothetical protein DFA_09257 [Cavenderia fasciculata]